jgi:acyl carrier protein
MQESEIYKQLTEMFRDVFMRDDIVLTPELAAKDVGGWDSFKQIEIMIAVQEKYKVKFRSRELDTLQNVGDLVSSLLAKLNTK